MRSRSGDVPVVSRRVVRYSALVAMLASALIFLPGPVLAQPAPDANSVIILASVDFGSYASKATALGLTVVSVTDAQWGARSTADFATFKAIIIGDPSCGSTVPPAALANRATWAAAIDGPILIIGTDEVFHLGQGGGTLISSGIGFVTSGAAGQTGAYISLSCYYNSAATGTAVPLLDPFGVFTVKGASCFNDSHIVAVHPALAGSTDATLSNWSCSVHEFFNSFPSASFLPLAIAKNAVGPGNLTFADGTNGIPYILASGGGISPVHCGNGIVEPPEECDDGNTVSGDGCSSFCTLEGPAPPPTVVPTLSFSMLGLLALALAAAALVLIRR